MVRLSFCYSGTTQPFLVACCSFALTHGLTIALYSFFLVSVACHKLNPSGGHGRCRISPSLSSHGNSCQQADYSRKLSSPSFLPTNSSIGAVTAMHDAIALANLIYAVPTTNSADLTRIFEEYQKERLPAVIESYKNSQLMSKIMDRGIEGAIILWLYTHIPFWLWRMVVRP